jgi:uncharacterized protein YndB with AHSA1/START domain
MPDNTISVTRLIEASPEAIWQALTQPDQVVQWWGPSGFTKTKVTLTNRFANEEEKAKHVEQMGAVKGAEQTLERLADTIKTN